MTLALTVLLQLLCPQPLSARDDSDDIYDMSLDENLLTPEIKNDKQADKIQLNTAFPSWMTAAKALTGSGWTA